MKNQHDSSLRIRLAGIAILGLLIALATAAYFSGGQVQRHSDLIAYDAVPGTIKAHYMRMAMSRSIGWAMVAASAQTEKSRDESLQIVHAADLAFADMVKEYEVTMKLNPKADRELLELLKDRYAEFYKQRMTYESLMLAGDRDGSAAFLQRDLVPAYLSAITSAEELLSYNHRNSISLANSIRSSVSLLDRTVVVVMVLALICVAILLMNFAIRRKELAELKEKEEKFAKAFQANPSGIAITEIETGRYIEVNDSFCRILGYPAQEVIGYTILDKGIWNTEEDQSRALQLLLKGGAMRNQEMRARTRYGVRKTVSVNAELIELGGKRCMVTLIEDITQRRQFELRQSELAAIVESSEDAIIGKTLAGIITSWNRGAEKIFGYTATEIIGQPLLILIPPERHHEETDILARIAQGQTVNHFETVRVNKDGRRISISATISPLRDADGRVIGASKIARDITIQKQAQEAIRESEERIRVLGDNLPNGMMYQLCMGADGKERRFTYISAGVEKLHEVTAEAVMEDAQVLYGQIVPADLQLVATREAEALAEMKPFVAELGMLLPSGAARWSIVASAPRRTINGVVVWDGIEIDITERKKLEQQFLRAQRMESIGTLASGVAHDLNNILTPIMMAVPMLRLKIPDVNREMIIDTIETSAERGAQIVKQVLTFGRGLDGEMQPLRVELLIHEMEKMICSTFPKDIAVESAIQPNLWLVLGDSTQLHQVLLNLCVNARDAMPGGGRLRLSAENLDIDASYASMLPEATPGPYLLVEVSDTGSGIPPEIIERIFDPFFTTKEIGKGTGLGLSTVHGIIKSHGGLLKVASEPGEGTTFQIYLPAATDQNLIQEATSTPPPSGQGELVLVVDDEFAITSAARAILEANGYRVLLAANGAEALELFAKNSREISVVLTDVMMPVMNGMLLLRSLREMRLDLPVIASTGLGEKKNMNELKALQIEVVLSKPYNAGMLLRAIHGVLHPKLEGVS